jgi:hypothetical protein
MGGIFATAWMALGIIFGSVGDCLAGIADFA